jgi:hypothetical protein
VNDPIEANEETGEIRGMETLALAPSVVEAQERAAIDVAVSTAKRYPRDVALFQRELGKWSMASAEVATECFYVLERENRRSGKMTRIVGPSVRFAELILAAYRNLVVDTRLESDDGERVTVVAICRDMERNVAQRVPVTRRITDRQGRRYSEDMVAVTIQAAAAVAKRNAIMGIVPKALWLQAYEQAMACARGDVKSMTERTGAALKALASVGVTELRVLAYLGKTSMKEVDADDLLALQVVYREVRSGERDPDSVGAKQAQPAEAQAKAAEAEKAVAAGRAKGRKPTAPPPPEAQAPTPTPTVTPVAAPAAPPVTKPDVPQVPEGAI